jgi:hypothetical protein
MRAQSVADMKKSALKNAESYRADARVLCFMAGPELVREGEVPRGNVWKDIVNVFELSRHPSATRC